jgi:DNA invertase Pin-like site-specific DNA recombinase
MPTNAALYLRSSKDRHDLSIDAQRRALHDHARDQSLIIVAEFADAVESGKDDDRPGFQRLLGALRDRDRGWTAILALDTSRIARRRHLALIFEHECERAGVAMIYKSVPDTDPITSMLLRSILQAMDEWHSLTSRAKGLAGMAESVRQGWRAGGSAPRGYRLEHSATGAMRDGQPVIRSRLTPGADADDVAAYLRARAAGKPRGLAAALSGFNGDNDLEWNALTYAGHTTWGMHTEQGTGTKRRPRDDWQITRNTHPALITEAEAEAILAQLTERAGRRNRAGDRVYLLSGLLVSPTGEPWAGEWSKGQAAYRQGKGRRVSARALDTAVVDAVFADLASPAIAAQLAERLRAAASDTPKPRDIPRLKARLATLDTKISRIVGLIAEDPDAAPAYRRAVAQMETERAALADELADATRAQTAATTTRLWTAADVGRMLGTLRESMHADMTEGRMRDLRTALAQLIERVEYDPDARSALIRYRLDTGVKLASPRGSAVAPVTWQTRVDVARRAA